MPKPNVTRVQRATPWCGSSIPLHMSKPVMLRHVVIALSFMPSFFVIHVWRSIIQMEKFQPRKSGAKSSKIRDVWNVSFFVVNYIGIWWSMKMWCCNCMENTHEVRFFQKTHTFLHFCTFFVNKMKVLHKEKNCQSWEYDGFQIPGKHAH